MADEKEKNKKTATNPQYRCTNCSPSPEWWKTLEDNKGGRAELAGRKILRKSFIHPSFIHCIESSILWAGETKKYRSWRLCRRMSKPMRYPLARCRPNGRARKKRVQARVVRPALSLSAAT